MISFIKKHSIFFSFIILAAASILFGIRFLYPLTDVVFEESYLQQCSYLDINILSLFSHGRIPLWAFHFGGGYPFIQHPENISLSPLFYLLILPFGSACGMKLMLVFSYFAGIFGMLLFTRKILKFNLPAAFFSSSIFIFSSFIPFQINTGNTRDQGWMYLPLLLFLITKSLKNFIGVLLPTLLIVLLIFTGFNLYVAPLFFFILAYSLLTDLSAPGQFSFPGKSKYLTRSFFMILFLSLTLGAVKLFPIISLLMRNARSIDLYASASAGAMTFSGFFDALFAKGPFAVGNEAVAGPNGLGMGCVFYFGYIPAILFLCSTIFCLKKIWKYIVLFFLFVIIAMADNFPVDIFNLLWHLPIFRSIHEPARYFGFPAIFCFSIISGAVLNSRFFLAKNRFIKAGIYILALYAVINMFLANSLYYEFAGRMHISPPRTEWSNNDFFNVRLVPFSRDTMPEPVRSEIWDSSYAHELGPGLQYFLLRQNIGLINWFGNIRLQENPGEKYRVTLGYGSYWKNLRKDPSLTKGVIRNLAYIDECYFRNFPGSNIVDKIEWIPNEISVSVRQTAPDILVINQNYDKYWKSSRGKVMNKNGLLCVFLDTPANGKINLTYLPAHFISGMILSLITLIFCLFKIFSERRLKK